MPLPGRKVPVLFICFPKCPFPVGRLHLFFLPSLLLLLNPRAAPTTTPPSPTHPDDDSRPLEISEALKDYFSSTNLKRQNKT
ncbi:hypothetical protein CCACVL1_23706 [Corchorus capsularis]|uniref:Uncharacterized protein n=1 Tax=Corchorus capsularis TaxID=210143 RepID=A0A1R3GSU2_COCAP|nr:hypothetical protein CCACVL1_23706 [Corchorus capsularis]